MQKSPGNPINHLLRRGRWILLGLVLFLGLGCMLWVILLPKYVVATIRERTGFVVQVGELAVNPFTARVTIKGMVIMNPPEWDGDSFVELREFRANSSVFALFSDRYVADEIVVDVVQVNLVRNKEGVLNALVFKNGLTGKDPNTTTQAGEAKGFLIKKLVLKFGKLTLTDHSDLMPGTRSYNLKVDTELHDVDNVAKLLSPFKGTASDLIVHTLSNVFTGSTDLLKGTAGLLEDAGKKTGEKLKGLLDSLDKKEP